MHPRTREGVPLYVDAFRLDKTESTPGGGLKIQAYPTRAGVLSYRRADGSVVRELRHPDDVFDPKSLATLQGRAVTDLHPTEGQVHTDNWKNLAVGHVSDSIGRDGDKVATSVYVNDGDMVRAIQEGKRKELSAGYHADTIDAPGTYEGQPYDRRQTNITYNHVGLGPSGWGRAGPECALRIDSAHAGLDILVNVGEGSDMKLRIDGKDYEPGSTEAQSAVDAIAKDRDTAKGALMVAETAAKTEKARADKAEAGVDPKKIGALVAERVALLENIRKGNAFFCDADDTEGEDDALDASADPVQLMTEALMKWQPSLDLKGKSPDIIMGAFMAMMAAVAGDDDKPAATTPLDSNKQPPANSPPEMELNGKPGAKPIRRRNDATDPSVTARTWLRSGKVDHDEDGYPRNDKGEVIDPREEGIKLNAARAMAPLAATKGA